MAANQGEIARKITVATVAGKATAWFDKLFATESGELKLMSVWGYANDTKPYVSEFGEGLKIVGDFQAVNAEDGVITKSPILILNTFIGDMFKGALDNPARTGPVRFAFEIWVKKDLTVATKYTYKVINLLPPEQEDPLTVLGASLGLVPALKLAAPAPTQAPAPAPTRAPAPTSKRK